MTIGLHSSHGISVFASSFYSLTWFNFSLQVHCGGRSSLQHHYRSLARRHRHDRENEEVFAHHARR